MKGDGRQERQNKKTQKGSIKDGRNANCVVRVQPAESGAH